MEISNNCEDCNIYDLCKFATIMEGFINKNTKDIIDRAEAANLTEIVYVEIACKRSQMPEQTVELNPYSKFE